MLDCDAVHERAAQESRFGGSFLAEHRIQDRCNPTNESWRTLNQFLQSAQQPPRTYATKVFVADCQSHHNLLNSHALLRPSECVCTHVDQAMKRPMYIGNGH